MSRIANYASQQILNSYMMTLQARINNTQVQLTTEQRAQSYAGIGEDTQRLVSYEVDTLQLKNYVKNNGIQEVRMQTTDLTLTGIDASLTEVKKVLTSYNNQQPTTENGIREVQETAFRELQSIQSYLNTEINGRYIFSGNRTNVKPVNLGLTTLGAFQDKYDGVNLSYPETRLAHLEDYKLAADSAGQTNWLTFTQDADGLTTTKGVGRITSTTAQFSNVAVGSNIEITGTANNNGSYTIEAVSADGKSVDVRTKMLTNKLNDISSTLTKTGGSTLSSANFTDLTFNRDAGTIVAGKADSISSITAGSTFSVAGSGENDGTYFVKKNDGTTLTIEEIKLTDEGTAKSNIINLTAQNFNFTVNAGNDTIASGVLGTFGALSAGMTISFGGTTNNNASYTIASVANNGQTLTVNEAVTAETGAGSTGTAVVVKAATNTLDLTAQAFTFTANTGANDTIDSGVTGTFTALKAGMKVTIGNTVSNNGTFTVASVSSDGKSVTVLEALTTESPVSIAQVSNVAWAADPTTTQVDTINISGTVEVGDVFTADVDGTAYAFTATAATAASVATGLAALINGNAGVTAASGGTSAITITGVAAGTSFATTNVTATDVPVDNTQTFSGPTGVTAHSAGVTAQVEDYTVGGTIEVGDQFSITLDVEGAGAVAYSFTAASTVANDVAVGLKAAIDAAGLDLTITAVGGVLKLTETNNAGIGFVSSANTATDRVHDNTQASALVKTATASLGYEVGDEMTMVINGNSYTHVLTATVSNVGAATAFLTAKKAAIEAAENVTIANNLSPNGTLVVTANAVGGTFSIDMSQTTNVFDVEAAPTITTVKNNDDTAVVTQADGTVQSINYYSGDMLSQTYRASDNRSITLDLNAVDPAFEKAIRALAILAQGKYGTAGGLDQSAHTNRIEDARNLMELAQNYNNVTNPKYEEGFTSSLQEVTLTLGYQRNTILNLNTDHTRLIGFYEARISTLEGIDKLAIITSLLDDQKALEASYQAMAKIRTLNLHNFLR
ncbi:MAG: hypothetical protein JKY92_00700 [Magnetovibrio sp.]|nr:hypothetical protein [Magnetovibrio sp.]